MAANTREKIIQAALASFATRGYEGTTLSQISDLVGIQKPSLYNHFSGKAELFLTVAEKVLHEMLDVMGGSWEKHKDEDVGKRLYLVLAESTSFIIQEHEGMIYRRLLLFPPLDLKEDLQALVQNGDQTIDYLLEIIYDKAKHEGAITDLHFSVFKASFYCLMDGLFTESIVYEEKEFRERFEGAWQVFWRGISAG
ncbi:TetR/AcrR family transcriptional regulator [Salicibibacter halophilus]|uniref:TetR/AcrR family transcriptional regulator n=1 Tax=Salicibibacter halophilus TaxID=2502791 RepID=A0A514LKW5_9BACI|nr:TetR/AcrR family transcriptional regulator [Salicibibacter halophilus]QDI92443.1 TetR/AcrR family transcriptional regulator [Salicibibacter halophilus]